MIQKLCGRVCRVFAAAIVVLVVTASARAVEVTVQNDSLAAGQTGNIQAGFVAGESAASWFTSPCDGSVIGVQVFWRSVDGTAPISLEDSITVFAGGTFPTPGAVLEAIIAPVMTDSVVNEFRFLDDTQTIPLIVPVTNGQRFVVSFKFANTPNALVGPSVVTDFDGCQSGSNALFAVPGGWFDSCLLGVTGDFFIRAVVDCGSLNGACCEVGGGCSDTTDTACTAAGGAFQGEGTNCASVTCSEACCFQPTGCLDLAVADCVVASGLAQGPGTACATTTCFPVGACCNPDGTCSDGVLDSDCIGAGGVFQGDGAVCSGVTCPQPAGACCLSNGGCLELSLTDCAVIPDTSWAGTLTDCTDADGNGTADDCEGCPPSGQPQSAEVLTPSGLLVPMRTMRMIGVRTLSANPGQSQALRVTATSLASPFDVWNGQSMWVGPPVEYSELPGRGFSTPGPLNVEDTFLSAPLQCSPFFMDWTSLGDATVWIRGELIAPSSMASPAGPLSEPSAYSLQFVVTGCAVDVEASFGPPMDIVTAAWGDIAELSQGEARAVNDSVGVEEFSFIVDKFSGKGGPAGSGGLPIKARTDMLGVFTGPSPVLDGVVSVGEVTAIVGAFGGGGYPFVPTTSVVCP